MRNGIDWVDISGGECHLCGFLLFRNSPLEIRRLCRSIFDTQLFLLGQSEQGEHSTLIGKRNRWLLMDRRDKYQLFKQGRYNKWSFSLHTMCTIQCVGKAIMQQRDDTITDVDQFFNGENTIIASRRNDARYCVRPHRWQNTHWRILHQEKVGNTKEEKWCLCASFRVSFCWHWQIIWRRKLEDRRKLWKMLAASGTSAFHEL